MKLFFLLPVFIALTLFATAQNYNEVYLGAITVDGAKPYSYRLEFSDSSNIISGFSITDLQGNDQTKTAIKGFFDKEKRTITFRETKLISTRSKINRDSFCYIRATLKLKKKRGNKLLVGTFTGFRNDRKTICGKGSMSLLCKTDIIHQIDKLGKVGDTLSKILQQLEGKQTELLPVEEIPESKSFSLQPSTKQKLECKANEALIEVWDNGKIDGDIVTIKHNLNTIYKGLRLTAKKENFTIKLMPNQTESLLLIADNEGSEPPATARMTCTCGKTVYTIDASSSTGKPVELVIIGK